MWNNYATPRGLFETRSALQIPSHLLVFKFDIFTWGNIICQCSDSQGSFTCSLTLIDKITPSGSLFKNIIWIQNPYLKKKKSHVRLDIFLPCEKLLSMSLTLCEALVLSLELEHSYNTEYFLYSQCSICSQRWYSNWNAKVYFWKSSFYFSGSGTRSNKSRKLS